MSTYSVKAGDNLWGIVKNHFKLTSSTDIANKVNEVAKANNISNANLIFAGQKINLDMGLTVEKESTEQAVTQTQTTPAATAPSAPAQTTPAAQQTATNPITKQAQTAASERINLNNIETYDDLNRLSSGSVSIFSSDVKTDEQKQQAYTAYSEQLLKEYYDLNGDGTVTTEEFGKKETEGSANALTIQGQKIDNDVIHDIETNPEKQTLLNLLDTNKDGKISQEEYEATLASLGLQPMNNEELNQTISERSGNLFARNLDMNGDGIISAQELAFFNKNADEMDGKADGVITNAGESGMFSAVTGMNANNQEINRVVNKYLSGETLTADEQKILEQSTITLRTNMKKAAGLDEE